MSESIQAPTQTPEGAPVPEAVRARWVRAYRRNQQIAVENMIARAETDMMPPARTGGTGWHALLTRTL
jgi:hypothetical protein